MSTTWDFETGVNGDALTTANSSSDSVNVVGGSAAISTTQAHSGTRSLHMTGTTTNGLVEFSKNLTSATTLNLDFYWFWTTLPSAEITLVRVLDSGAAQNWQLNCNGSGRLRLYNSAGTSIWLANSGANAMVTGRWYHVTLTSTQNATTGTVQVVCVDTTTSTTICDSSSTGGVPTSLTSGAQNTGANSFASFRLGLKAGTSTATGDGYIDDYTFDTGSTPANVTAVAATATGAAVPPAVAGAGGVTAVAASATGQAGVPTVTGELVTTGGGPATASVLALPPTVTGSAAVATTAATGTGQAVAPAVAVIGAVTAVTATATALAPPPAAAGTANVAAVKATGTGTAAAPAVAGGATVAAVVATCTAAAIPPSVSATGVGSVTAVAATTTGQAIAPTVTAVANATVTAVRATATGTANAPTLQYAYTVTALTATATATAVAPVVAGSAAVTATVAAGTAQAVAPAVTTGATVVVPVASATGAARPPTLILGATVTAVRATSSAVARSPVVTVYDPTVTPPYRTFVVVYESRTKVVSAEVRTLAVAAETRTLTT